MVKVDPSARDPNAELLRVRLETPAPVREDPLMRVLDPRFVQDPSRVMEFPDPVTFTDPVLVMAL